MAKKNSGSTAPAVIETTVVEEKQFLNWAEKGYAVQPLTLDMLERTQHENDTKGKPVQGIYHFALINEILQMANNYGLKVEVYDMFAAQNRHKYMPGVSVIKQIEDQYGERAVEAHILRRVFANMYIHNYDTDEVTTGLSVAFHQNGIQVGMGPNVKICHNQCLLNPKLYAATYGDRKQTVENLIQTVGMWFEESSTLSKRDIEMMNAMKSLVIPKPLAMEMIGRLTAIRVMNDVATQSIIHQNNQYPLNQGQISEFTENVLVQYAYGNDVTLWDFYNHGNCLYKANRMDIPQVIPQNRAFVLFLVKFLSKQLQEKLSFDINEDYMQLPSAEV